MNKQKQQSIATLFFFEVVLNKNSYNCLISGWFEIFSCESYLDSFLNKKNVNQQNLNIVLITTHPFE